MKKRNETGQLMIIVALAMVVFLGFAALAIDLGRGYSERRNAQNAADAAALAGMRLVRGEPNPSTGQNDPGSTIYAAIQAEVSANAGAQILPDAQGGAVFLDANKNVLGNVSTWTSGYSGVYGIRVSTRIQYATTFASILGYSQMTSDGVATAMSFPVNPFQHLLPIAVHTNWPDNDHCTDFGYTPTGGAGGTAEYTFFDGSTTAGQGQFGWISFDGSGSASALSSWIINGYSGSFTSLSNFAWTGIGGAPVTLDPTACANGFYYDGGGKIDPTVIPKTQPLVSNPSTCDNYKGDCDLKGSAVYAPNGATVQVNSWFSGNSGMSLAQVKDALLAMEHQSVTILVYNKMDLPGNNALFQIVGWLGFTIDDVNINGSNTAISGHFNEAVLNGPPTPVPTTAGISTVRLVAN